MALAGAVIAVGGAVTIPWTMDQIEEELDEKDSLVSRFFSFRVDNRKHQALVHSRWARPNIFARLALYYVDAIDHQQESDRGRHWDVSYVGFIAQLVTLMVPADF